MTSLAQAYNERDQPAQATRILQMLAASGTGKLGTRRLGTGALPAPQAATTRFRQTGGLAPRQTSVLRQTVVLGPTGQPGQPEPVDPPAPFPPTALTFTIPLPDQHALADELRAIVEASAEDLEAGRLEAAYDACLEGLRLDDACLPLSIRIAEIYTAQRFARCARVQAETILRLMAARGDTEWQ